MSYQTIIKAVLHVLCLLPLARLIIKYFQNDLTANPIEFLTHSTGTWALVILLASLTITPLRKIKALNWTIKLRKMLGLYAFLYVCLHFAIYIVLDHFFDWTRIVEDIAKRPYVTVGFAAFVLLVPLALTSNKFSIRKLTGKRWQQLHWLVYPAAIGGVVHFYWLVKADTTEPMIYAAVLAVLLGIRILYKLKPPKRSPREYKPDLQPSK
ncbi:MAG TPA: protein-methionine-sulfoxide reductase heme-binding subunit MsrQ [Blastocatellia bacterium]|nr:protein-methionine-sulfoxide reductase heme-binding subunit MsrQ [Blastocatellia bacterium]